MQKRKVEEQYVILRAVQVLDDIANGVFEDYRVKTGLIDMTDDVFPFVVEMQDIYGKAELLLNQNVIPHMDEASVAAEEKKVGEVVKAMSERPQLGNYLHHVIDEIAKEVGGFDFILADLGVSSMQIDNPKRGFSFKVDGPLDLRLNQEKGISAAERLDNISEEELAGMLYENSDEPYCEELAKAITTEIRKGNRIDTTTKLRNVIEKTLDFLPNNKEKKDIIKKTCQRTFQALRIDVNNEFEVLYEFMEKLPGALKPGGRVAILTFHSGEDKLVKKALKAGYKEGIYSEYARDVVRPSAQECAQNGRARSTKMRWAVKAE